MSLHRQCLVFRAEHRPRHADTGQSANTAYRNPQLSIESRPVGELADDALRVDMAYVGICGTDIHMLQTDTDGYVKSSAPARVPEYGRVFGHEGVGRIRAVGKNVRHFTEGDWVALESILTCNQCEPCRRGQFNQCRQAQLIGLQEDGMFASMTDTPARMAHKVNDMVASHPDGLRAAACLEPAGVAWTACEKAAITGHDRVLILGAGPIGIFCAMLSRLIFGAQHISIVDPVTYRQELASTWCDRTSSSLADVLASDQRFDAVIEASGDLEGLATLIKRIDANGRVILLARSGNSLHLETVDHLITHAISITGVRGHLGGAFNSLIRLYVAGRLPLHAIVTGQINSLGALREVLLSPEQILRQNCKVLFHAGTP